MHRIIQAVQASLAAQNNQVGPRERTDYSAELFRLVQSLLSNIQIPAQQPQVPNDRSLPPPASPPVHDPTKLRAEYDRGFTKGEAHGLTEGRAKGSQDTRNRLLALGVFSNQSEPTPLMRAVLQKSHSDVKLLYENKVDFNQISMTMEGSSRHARRLSPLCAAVEMIDPVLVQALLDFGALIDQEQPEGSNALLIAAAIGNEDVLSKLLENKAQVLLESQHRTGEFEGYDPLCIAIHNGHTGAAKLLFEEAGFITKAHNLPLRIAAAKGNYTVVHHLLKHHINPNNNNNPQRTAPLFSAITTGQTDIIRLLLRKNANLELFNAKNHTPLLHALFGDSELVEERRIEIIELILKENAQLQHSNGSYSALIQAVMNGHQRFVKLLVQRGADLRFVPNSQTGMKPAIYEALNRGSLDIAETLFEAGATLEERNELCACPFEEAINNGNIKTLECLLRRNTYETFLQQWPQSRVGPLHLAISESNIDMMQFLIAHGADTEFSSLQGDDGNYRPLHHAAKMLNLEAVTILLDSNVAKQEKTLNGQCVTCSTPGNRKAALPSYVQGLYPRCYLENQKSEALQNDATSILWERIERRIKEAGGNRPPYHQKEISTSKPCFGRGGALIRHKQSCQCGVCNRAK